MRQVKLEIVTAPQGLLAKACDLLSGLLQKARDVSVMTLHYSWILHATMCHKHPIILIQMYCKIIRSMISAQRDDYKTAFPSHEQCQRKQNTVLERLIWKGEKRIVARLYHLCPSKFDFLYKDYILQLHCSLTKRWILENVHYLKLIWFSWSNEENHTKL